MAGQDVRRERLLGTSCVCTAAPSRFSGIRSQAAPPLKRLSLVRNLLPSNPFLGFAKNGCPVTLLSVGASDTAAVTRALTGDDLVRTCCQHRPICPRAARLSRPLDVGG